MWDNTKQKNVKIQLIEDSPTRYDDFESMIFNRDSS